MTLKSAVEKLNCAKFKDFQSNTLLWVIKC